MKDFPVFTTQFGVASIVLSQIPYTGCAYVTIRDSVQPLALLKECADFCYAVGAASVFATGHTCLEIYPLHTKIILMRSSRERLDKTDAVLIPVQNEMLEQFREIYNGAMKNVANAAYMTITDSEKILSESNGYFVYRDRELLGIGIAGGERIDAIVSVVPGSGQDVLRALNCALSGSWIEVEVASTNLRAIRLYEKMGFVQCEELSKWYKII